MTHTELRVGNWVRTCTPNMEIMIPHMDAQVRGIDFLSGKIAFHSDTFLGNPQEEVGDGDFLFSMLPQHVIGIPLDAEWLERFGFNVRNHSARIGSGRDGTGMLLTVIRDGGLEKWRWLIDDGSDTPTSHDIHVMHVHQLQNLYFALTGQELTYDATKHQPDPDSPRP